MADNLLDKASILLTPTAYNDGSMLSVKPNENLYGSELVTNGDFATDSNWTKGTGWSISGGSANCDGSQSSNSGLVQQNGILGVSLDLVVGRTYKMEFNIVVSSGFITNIEVGGNYKYPGLSSSGTYTFYFTPTSTNDRITFTASSSLIGSIDNVSVKEGLTGDFTFSRGSAATRVNAQGLVEEITDTDIPRIDYTDGCGSWLLEPQSTNLYLNSETLSTQSNTTSASTYTVSFYGTGTITFSGTHTGTLVGTAADERVSATFTATSGTLTSTISGTCEKGQLEGSNGLGSFDGSYATSYIPTNGAANTRLQDIANNSGNSTLINSTEGVLYAEISLLSPATSSTIISLSDGGANRLYFEFFTSNRLYAIIENGSSSFNTVQTITQTDNNKIAFKYSASGCKLYINGTGYSFGGLSFSSETLDRLNFASSNGTSSPFYGKTKAIAVYKEALTDAELQSLTTI